MMKMIWSRSMLVFVFLVGTVHMKHCRDSNVIGFCDTNSKTGRKVFVEFSQQMHNLTTCECIVSLARVQQNQKQNNVINASLVDVSIMGQAYLQFAYTSRDIRVITPANGTMQLNLNSRPESNKTVSIHLREASHSDVEACLKIKGVKETTVRVSCRGPNISSSSPSSVTMTSSLSPSTTTPSSSSPSSATMTSSLSPSTTTLSSSSPSSATMTSTSSPSTTTLSSSSPSSATMTSSLSPSTTTASSLSPLTTTTTSSSSLSPSTITKTITTGEESSSTSSVAHTQHNISSTPWQYTSSDSDQSTPIRQTTNMSGSTSGVEEDTVVTRETVTGTTMSNPSNISAMIITLNSSDQWNLRGFRLPLIIGALAVFNVLLIATIVTITFHRRRQMHRGTRPMATLTSAVSVSDRFQRQATADDLANVSQYAQIKASSAVMMNKLKHTDQSPTLHYEYTNLLAVPLGREHVIGMEKGKSGMHVEDGSQYPGCVQSLPREAAGYYACINEDGLKTGHHTASSSGSPRPAQERHYRNCAPALTLGDSNKDVSLTALPPDLDDGIVKFNQYNNVLYNKHIINRTQISAVSSQKPNDQVKLPYRMLASDMTMNDESIYDRACHTPLIKPKMASVESKTYSKLNL